MAELGLALGGGGARGLAHIGVLKVLERERIHLQAITGCSMGSVVGGLYAYYGNAQKVHDLITQFIKSPFVEKLGLDSLKEDKIDSPKTFFEQFFDFVEIRLQAVKALGRTSYFDEETTRQIFEIIPDVPIEELPIPFSAIATDLISGNEINFCKGSLRDAVRASSSIPGIFPPVAIDDYLLVDGSASESVPAGRVREIGANRVLAVDVTKDINVFKEPNNILEILLRTESITSFQLSKIRLKEADLVIHPHVKQFSWVDFDQANIIINAGEIATLENLEEIKKLANRNSYLVELEHYIKRLTR